jgi:hypothetical protein
MSFGLLKHFKDKKVAASTNIQSPHFEHIIIGQDLGSVLKLVELKRTLPAASVKLISPRLLSKAALIENYQFGVSQLRSSEAVEGIYRKFHDAKIIPQAHDALFYKDGKFHEFSGRAKSMELAAAEDFFKTRGYKFEVSSFFTVQEWENLDAILNESLDLRIFDSIDKTSPQDLVQKAEWQLTFKDFSKMTCENLYVSMSPKKFLGHLDHKEKLTPELIDVCSAAQVQAAISVTWVLNKEVHATEQTLFIPQSMTHEWGHFIVEFESYDYQKKEQICHALFLIHEEEPQSEDLASKIKLMKRVLDRVFPTMEEATTKEYIRLDEEMFVSGIKDSAQEQLSFDYPTLKFLGQMSSMPTQFLNEKFLARTLLH